MWRIRSEPAVGGAEPTATLNDPHLLGLVLTLATSVVRSCGVFYFPVLMFVWVSVNCPRGRP